MAEKERFELYSAEPKRLGVSRVAPCCGVAATLAEQPSLAALASELADALSLGYLRRPLCGRRK